LVNLTPIPIQPLPINPFFFVDLPLDVALMYCQYLSQQDVEALGSTCHAARERLHRLKKLPNFFQTVIPEPRYLTTDWSRPATLLKWSLPQSDFNRVVLEMNAKGDYLYVLLDHQFLVYQQRSLSPLQYRERARLSLSNQAIFIVGMDNSTENPGVYCWDSMSCTLFSWHVSGGWSQLATFPQFFNVAVHSKGGGIYVYGVDAKATLTLQEYRRGDQELQAVNAPIQKSFEGLTPSYILKLSPGGQMLILGSRDTGALQILCSRTLTLRRIEQLEFQDTPSITDDGGTLFNRAYFKALDALKSEVMPTTFDYSTKSAHSGNGRIVIAVQCYLDHYYTRQQTDVLMHITPPKRQNCRVFTIPKVISQTLENALLRIKQIDREHLAHEFRNNRELTLHANVLIKELRHASPHRLSAIYQEFNHNKHTKGLDSTFFLMLCDVVHGLNETEVHHHPSAPLDSLVNAYISAQQKKPKRMTLAAIHACTFRSGDLLIDLCRRTPHSPPLVDVLCQSSNAWDKRNKKNLIPKLFAHAMLVTPDFRNYIVLEALLKKMVAWTDDEKKQQKIEAICNRMVRAAEQDPSLQFDTKRLLMTRFDDGESVLECLDGTPFYQDITKYFGHGIDCRAAHEEPQRKRGCGL